MVSLLPLLCRVYNSSIFLNAELRVVIKFLSCLFRLIVIRKSYRFVPARNTSVVLWSMYQFRFAFVSGVPSIFAKLDASQSTKPTAVDVSTFAGWLSLVKLVQHFWLLILRTELFNSPPTCSRPVLWLLLIGWVDSRLSLARILWIVKGKPRMLMNKND